MPNAGERAPLASSFAVDSTRDGRRAPVAEIGDDGDVDAGGGRCGDGGAR